MGRRTRIGFWGKFFMVATFLLILLAGAWLARLASWARQLEALKQEWRRAGYPVTVVELNAWYSQPDGPNAADQYVRLEKELVPAPWEAEPEIPEPAQGFDGPTLAVIQEYLDKNRKALATLHEAAKIDGCRYPLDFSEGLSLKLPSIQPAKQAAVLLKLECLVHAQAGRTEPAIDSLEALYRLAMSFDRQPLLLSCLFRWHLIEHWRTALENTVNLIPVDDASLARWQEQARQAEVSDSLTRALVGEFVAMKEIFSGSRDVIAMAIGHTQPGIGQVFLGKLRRLAFGAADELAFMRYMKEWIDLSRAEPGPSRKVTAKRLDQTIFQLPWYCWLTRRIAPSMTGAFDRNDQGVAHLRLCRAALAARRYQLKHGRWPDTLEAMVGQFLDAVPIDPFSAGPLHYVKTNDGGILVYSIGADGADDGGKRHNEKGESGKKGTDLVFVIY